MSFRISLLLVIFMACSPAGQREERTLVQVGLDRVAQGDVGLAADAKFGLIVHPASVAADGRHSIEVLQSAGVNIVRLFGPEHGLRGQAAAGERVADGRDPVSGLPVVSLYGEFKKPRAEDLADLDGLIFDLQGAGVRFYTYVSTLILSLEAAAESGIEFIVLDRPNPLGGNRIEGPVAAPREVVPASFVNMAPGPLVHGLTLGEMARFVNSRPDKPARLRVIEMVGWRRSMTWKDTGRAWIPPSPNLRSAEAALAYPGVALLEVTNVSEGRGTETPFLLFGAPWLEHAALDLDDLGRAVPGVRLSPTQFEPVAGPAAPHPKFANQLCQGFRIEVTNGSALEGYRLGLELVSRLARQDAFTWRQDGHALTWLLGTPSVFEALAASRAVSEIVGADASDHERWRSERAGALLY